jgi:hypothetical protein
MLEQPVIAMQPMERRSKPRIDCSYPAIVQGWDADGRKFRSNATLTNISATGICLKLQADFQPGKDLFVVFSCSSTGPLGQSKAPLIAVNGELVRSDQPTPGLHAVALKIRRNRFL